MGEATGDAVLPVLDCRIWMYPCLFPLLLQARLCDLGHILTLASLVISAVWYFPRHPLSLLLLLSRQESQVVCLCENRGLPFTGVFGT